jgi:hypothetical protein
MFTLGAQGPSVSGAGEHTNADAHLAEAYGALLANTVALVRTHRSVRWSCRESNPGPLTPNQVFSERSLLGAFLGPDT